jgi:hypothetical protein
MSRGATVVAPGSGRTIRVGPNELRMKAGPRVVGAREQNANTKAVSAHETP